MKVGALIFAFNSDQVDYQKIASWNADNIHRHLGIPVALVTNKAPSQSNFDCVIVVDLPDQNHRYSTDNFGKVPWYNRDRCSAFDLSPWDLTLLIDADYVVASDDLLTLLTPGHELLCFRQARDITQPHTHNDFFGEHRMPMWWATVMIFDKCRHAELVFGSMRMIQENWQHYRDIYKIARPYFRNDYALSIALGIVTGHSYDVPTIPWCLNNVMPEHSITKIAQDRYRITYQDQLGRTRYIEHASDLHLINKSALEVMIDDPS